ncbi:TIGR03086 family metal-binding protein [Arthrobacter sp. E3]|uniref:TIGR03086 family metal-binding protein n=1 Tax=Arthrobacter sp. E3 TaxID=517402 RepID=UPI001A94AF59|nr:TIGR03086 family metal-binding protein [Arthrobacter sp. E3]
MNSTISAFEAANTPLTQLLDTVRTDQWDSPSPCEGWTVRNVVGHLMETQREFLGRNNIDIGKVADAGGDPASTWRSHSAAVLDAVSTEAVANREFDGAFGRSTIGETLVQFYVWDMVAHRWDIARSLGQDPSLTDTELDRLERGITSFGDALYMDGICKPGVRAPADADRATLVLARLGRHV